MRRHRVVGGFRGVVRGNRVVGGFRGVVRGDRVVRERGEEGIKGAVRALGNRVKDGGEVLGRKNLAGGLGARVELRIVAEPLVNAQILSVRRREESHVFHVAQLLPTQRLAAKRMLRVRPQKGRYEARVQLFDKKTPPLEKGKKSGRSVRPVHFRPVTFTFGNCSQYIQHIIQFPQPIQSASLQ